MRFKRRIIDLIVVGCILGLMGCGKKYSAADFVGVWDSEYELGDETVEFYSDGTFEKDVNSIIGNVYVTGKYSVSDNLVTVYFDQTGETDIYSFTFSDDDKMIWIMESFKLPGDDKLYEVDNDSKIDSTYIRR